ncbi:putative Ig domain-containing protein [Kutzneria chonburiensis]|uniref:Ig domain-containing protein n=1 Tax=Kutzneria chonburiensis TaxID=1483604 RepID=A0ABV6N6R3_9PSEU|nr:putative Ig domain-containing protein [Kutzneria chonburiensis]
MTGKNAQHTHTATISLTVQPGSSGPVTVADPGFQLVHNQTVTLSLKASGGTGSYRWSATGLPPGLSLDPATGVITGRPATGSYQSPVTATDTAGASGKTTVYWFVY